MEFIIEVHGSIPTQSTCLQLETIEEKLAINTHSILFLWNNHLGLESHQEVEEKACIRSSTKKQDNMIRINPRQQIVLKTLAIGVAVFPLAYLKLQLDATYDSCHNKSKLFGGRELYKGWLGTKGW